MIDRDMIDHLEAQGFRVVPADKLQKFSIRHCETLRAFNTTNADLVTWAKKSMAMRLSKELLDKAGWTVEDRGDLRVFTTELEVIG